MAMPRQAHILSALILTLLLAAGCGEDSAGPGGGGSTIREGTFVDSAVQGMGFASGDESGLTDGDGTFSYPSSAAVITFRIGGIVVGSARPAALMTPLTLSPGATDLNDPLAINIARLLQTLDDDADVDNGILITEAVRTAAADASVDFDQDMFSFEADTNVQAVVTALTTATTAGERAMVSAQAAQQHLAATLTAALQGQYSGKYCRDTGNEGAQENAGTWEMTIDGSVVTIEFTGTPNFTVTGTFDEYGNLDATGPADEFVYGGYDGHEFWGRWYVGDFSGSFSESSNCNR